MEKIKTLFEFVKKYKYYFLTIIALIFIISFIITKGRQDFEITEVKRGSITNEVLVSGRVNSPSQVELSFKDNGRLVYFPRIEGDEVKQGDVIARLDTKQIDTQIAQVKATLDLQKAKLDQLIAGASPEDISVAEANVLSAKNAVLNAKDSQTVIARDAYTKSDDAIKNKTDGLFSNPSSVSANINIITNDSNLESEVERQRVELEHVLNDWKNSIQDEKKANNNLLQVLRYLDDLANLLNNGATIAQYSNTVGDISTYKNNVSNARTTVNQMLTSLVNSENTIRLNESQTVIAEEQLRQKKAGPRATDKEIYETQIRQAEANYNQVLAQRSDYTIVSPVAGKIINKHAEVGEIVSNGKTIVTMISNASYEVEADISEVNISKIHIGQKVRITLDSFPDIFLTGTLTHVDPSGSNVSGAIYYKTKITMDKNNLVIRPKMTANVWIEIDKKESVAYVTLGAIKEVGGKTFATAIDKGRPYDIEVVTGIKDVNGNVEIVKGLQEGEKILIQK